MAKQGDKEHREAARERMLEYWASGKAHNRKKVPKEVWDKIGAENAIRNKGKILRKKPISIEEINKFKEMIKINPLTREGPENIHSRFFTIRSPTNMVYSFKNLSNFVRENPHLFSVNDVVWFTKKGKSTPTCRAINGLQMISPRKKNPAGMWKGWTWADTFYVDNNKTI